jgi:hypothetical protein
MIIIFQMRAMKILDGYDIKKLLLNTSSQIDKISLRSKIYCRTLIDFYLLPQWFNTIQRKCSVLGWVVFLFVNFRHHSTCVVVLLSRFNAFIALLWYFSVLFRFYQMLLELIGLAVVLGLAAKLLYLKYDHW